MFNYAELYQLHKREQAKNFQSDIPLYQLDTRRLCQRDNLIQWIVNKASSFQYSIKTIELTVFYIDTYLNSFNISTNYLQLLAISALQLAAKFNQTEVSSQVKLVNSMGLPIYEESEYDDMEIQILSTLKFQSNYVTTSDYLDTLKVNLNESLQSLLIFILIDFEIYRYSHLELALAVIEFQSPHKYSFSSKIKAISDTIKRKLLAAQGLEDHQEEESAQIKSARRPAGVSQGIRKTRQARRGE